MWAQYMGGRAEYDDSKCMEGKVGGKERGREGEVAGG